MTAARVSGRQPAYEDELDLDRGAILYRYRAGPIDQPDNRALRAALELQAPLIYFHGIARGQYHVVQPVFVTGDDPGSRTVLLEVGLPAADVRGEGLFSSPDGGGATRSGRFVSGSINSVFRQDVLRAYQHRCTVCALREPALVQAAHIVEDREEQGVSAVVNGLALCAIHHIAYDRNLMGIDPEGVVHIARRLRDEQDGPMLREGLQGFHGSNIVLPRRVRDRPEPRRLEERFDHFVRAAPAA